MSEPREESAEADHLDGVDDGLGCAEVWEELSERREQEANGDGAGRDEKSGDDAEGAAGGLDETADGIAGLADEAESAADEAESRAEESET